jgi:hypothetical protein
LQTRATNEREQKLQKIILSSGDWQDYTKFKSKLLASLWNTPSGPLYKFIAVELYINMKFLRCCLLVLDNKLLSMSMILGIFVKDIFFGEN